MKIKEMYETMAKLYSNGIVDEAFGIHLAISFERALRFSEPGKSLIVIDLGTGGGSSCGPLISMAVACKFLDGKAYTVDKKNYPEAKKTIEDYGLSSNVEFLVFDDVSEEAKKFFENIKPNVIFVDTSHEYEHTKKEIEFYSKILSINGFMIFHDTYDTRYGYGVWKALTEFLDGNSSFILEDKRDNSNGIAVIKKIGE